MKAVQLARWKLGTLELCDDAITQLAGLKTSISGVVAVVGPAGDGKSTLCNTLVANFRGTDGTYEQLFPCGETPMSAVTRGVWIAAVPLPSRDATGAESSSVIVLDAEGLDMGDAEAELSLSLFAASMASHVLYNVRGPRLRHNALSGLSLIGVASRMAKGLDAEAPQVTLLVRDSVLSQDALSSIQGLVDVKSVCALPPPDCSTMSADFAGNEKFILACRQLSVDLQLSNTPKLLAGAPVDGHSLAALLVSAALGSAGLGAVERKLLASNCSEEELEQAYVKAAKKAASVAEERDALVDNATAAAEVAALPDNISDSSDD